ncbi:MAG: hypothetical protein R3E88_08620 [Myxococcota bacterium]|nr:hypothetical protein [Myxococcales bacterium]
MSDALSKEFERAIDAVCDEQGWKRTRDEIEVPIDGGRRQIVTLDAFEFDDEPLVRLASGIGPTEHIDPLHLNTALRLNYGLPHGALALRGDQLVLVDTLMADDPDREEIEAVLRYLAETADHFERTIFGTDEV